MVAFAFLFAPIAFSNVGPTPAFAATIAACVRAIATGGIWIGVGVVVITNFARIDGSRIAAAIVGCMALAIAGGLIETSLIVPKMETTPLLTAAYEALHRTSSGVYSVVSIAVFAALILTLGSRYRSR